MSCWRSSYLCLDNAFLKTWLVTVAKICTAQDLWSMKKKSIELYSCQATPLFLHEILKNLQIFFYKWNLALYNVPPYNVYLYITLLKGMILPIQIAWNHSPYNVHLLLTYTGCLSQRGRYKMFHCTWNKMNGLVYSCTVTTHALILFHDTKKG
jgi:hypothetical protein